MPKRLQQFDTLAAVDLGSNSFHMIVVRVRDQHVHVLDRLREPVRLAMGLDERGRLSREAIDRALDCLKRFGQRVRELPLGSVRAVGTNTLRHARMVEGFQEQARLALGHPIEIIAGREEARLIYLGVSHSLADTGGRRLVVDIGGGSTELIIGERFEPLFRESLHMGCVNMGRWYFEKGQITAKCWRAAEIAAQLELQPIQALYTREGWDVAVGASGTILSIERILHEQGWADSGITPEGLLKLRQALLDMGHVDKIVLRGLSEDRRSVLVGGVVILLSIFQSLGIRHMQVSDGALREGLIYDMLGRFESGDVRGRSVDGLMERFSVDRVHAQRVERTALELLEQAAEGWNLDQDHADLLAWAARLHELGLGISHSCYHKHGAYLLENADLGGFSLEGQRQLAILVRAHRRKFPRALIEERSPADAQLLTRLAILLRVSVVLHRARAELSVPISGVKVSNRGLKLRFDEGWLEANPLTYADLEREAEYLKSAGLKLGFQ